MGNLLFSQITGAEAQRKKLIEIYILEIINALCADYSSDTGLVKLADNLTGNAAGSAVVLDGVVETADDSDGYDVGILMVSKGRSDGVVLSTQAGRRLYAPMTAP